ncbi:MAG: universal stress protein [Acidimicrobiales bacterium]|nr:universal stress protein [Acidimicrobiales bacterium]
MALIRTIAVGFDGSPDVEPAVRWSIDLAKQIGGEVVVVHAIGLLEHAAQPGIIAELEKAVRDLSRERGIEPAQVHWHPVDGDPCSALIRVASAPVAADLIVVGSRGQGAHSGLLLGSTSLELAERTTIPLVIVPMAGPDPD